MSCNNIPTRLRYLPGHAGVQAYDPDDTGQVDLAKVMDLLDDHKVKKHGSDTERLKKQLSSRQPQDKHHITFEEFCSALECYADDSNQEFGEKLETASSASGQQHKRVLRPRARVTKCTHPQTVPIVKFPQLWK